MTRLPDARDEQVVMLSKTLGLSVSATISYLVGYALQEQALTNKA